MKKYPFITLAMLVCAFSLSGCTAQNDEQQPAASETAAVNSYEAKESDTIVSGEVTAVTGNRVTLALGTITADEEESAEKSTPPGQDGKEMPDFENGERPDFKSGEMPDFSNGERPDFANGERPDFSNGEMPDFDQNGFGGRDGGRKKSAALEKNGSECSYIIPVGMPVDGLTGRSSDYSGIKTGMVLTLTVNEKGIVCAANVN